MSWKDQTPFFSDPPPWYFHMMAVICCVATVPSLFISVLCLPAHEYWPLPIFGITIFCMVFSARNLWRKARLKENERAVEGSSASNR